MSTTAAPGIDWALLLRPGDRIACAHMTGEPVALLRDLAASPALRATGFSCSLVLGVPFTEVASTLPEEVGITSFGGMGTAGAMMRSRAMRISQAPYGRCDSMYRNGEAVADVVLVSLARAGDGSLMLAGSHGYVVDAARRARCIVAEVNAQAPRVPGAPWPEDLAPHHLVEVSYPPPAAETVAIGAVERAIGERVAACVPDGACLQVGIGSIPSAVLQALAGHRHLGLHSGMLTNPVAALMRGGALDHSRKPAGSRLAITGCIYGPADFYEWVDGRTDIALREPAYTHDPFIIAQLPDFTAINSAIEVDLLGQMNAEWIAVEGKPRRHIGGVGGLNDFMRAAFFAPRGQAITALPSRAGGRPRIVARLSGPATVASQDADVIVTEHGTARLRNANLDQRAQRMIAIAHPDDRDALVREARSLGLDA